ncbi:hypothetical protein Pmani_032784 [Petrolisthes manimaculis]|uniref:Uncharacterized protein n=1 Tax=Petrolisthes manimaculis TaxID=1843537 RepID=A0AAE1NSA6_9EUCA|nr:hypothetical protein Pmani_032784 [Petrolisthes manimaculis]
MRKFYRFSTNIQYEIKANHELEAPRLRRQTEILRGNIQSGKGGFGAVEEEEEEEGCGGWVEGQGERTTLTDADMGTCQHLSAGSSRDESKRNMNNKRATGVTGSGWRFAEGLKLSGCRIDQDTKKNLLT